MSPYTKVTTWTLVNQGGHPMRDPSAYGKRKRGGKKKQSVIHVCDLVITWVLHVCIARLVFCFCFHLACVLSGFRGIFVGHGQEVHTEGNWLYVVCSLHVCVS